MKQRCRWIVACTAFSCTLGVQIGANKERSVDFSLISIEEEKENA
jgi:hypothetical protein